MLTELKRKEALIIDWAKARKIIPNGRAKGQWLKGISEIGELADGMAKNDRAAIRDAIGDIFVCLVNYCALQGIATNFLLNAAERKPEPENNLADLLNRFSHLYVSESPASREMAVALVVSYLSHIAVHYQLSLPECVDYAWEEIKDRKGTTTPEGVFIKE